MAGAKTALEHTVWNLLKENSVHDKRILVSFSGGADSLALLLVLKAILPVTNLAALYFHHGDSVNLQSARYRDQALRFCEQICQALRVPFLAARASEELQSEEEFRQSRYQALEKIRQEQAWDFLALGHHLEDLLETRLLRLIRGTGLQGLESMRFLEGSKLRPFLQISKKDLLAYLVEKKQTPLEDPSNQDLDPMRNWVRLNWLPALEERQKGAVESLGRSIERLVAEYHSTSGHDLLQKALSNAGDLSLVRPFYLTLTAIEQRTLLAQYLHRLGRRDFSQSHLEEIQKRLDNSQKVLTFKVAGCVWVVNAQQIRVQS